MGRNALRRCLLNVIYYYTYEIQTQLRPSVQDSRSGALFSFSGFLPNSRPCCRLMTASVNPSNAIEIMRAVTHNPGCDVVSHVWTDCKIFIVVSTKELTVSIVRKITCGITAEFPPV